MAVAPLPFTLTDIITKVRRITARPSAQQISDTEILRYINTFYIFNMPEKMKVESLRFQYQFTTQPNISVYDMPTDIWLASMPPVYIAGYQSYMTQSRQNFFRINPQLEFLQGGVYTGNGTAGPYTGQFLTNTPMFPGFKPNPPGAYSTTACQAKFINWNVMVYAQGTPNATSGISPQLTLVDDGQGNLIDPMDPATPPTYPTVRGSVNYTTGAISINSIGFCTPGQGGNNNTPVPSGNNINAQYIPYVPSRPQSVCFYQDQFYLYPCPDQSYIVSFEAYRYPIALNTDATQGEVATIPQVKEWWELLAYGAADKIFADAGDLENMQKYRPLLDEQLRLALRRTLQQQSSERVATIYTESNMFPGYPGSGGLFPAF